jgi:serine/threonine protein kinase
VLTREPRVLIKKLLVVNPEDRATVEVVKADPWFNQHPFVDVNAPPKLTLRELDELSDMPMDDDESSDDEIAGHVHVEGLRISNAFELIALSGVFDLVGCFVWFGFAFMCVV